MPPLERQGTMVSSWHSNLTLRRSVLLSALTLATVVVRVECLTVRKILRSASPCSNEQFKCVAKGNCVPRTWQCDATWDCRDGSDEQDCHASRTCLEAEFRCEHGGRCIPAAWRCDGDRDCIDGSDESGSLCADAQTCEQDEFSCDVQGNRSMTCLSRARWCDGKSDCDDGTDEKNCTNTRPCTEARFRCRSSGSCIPLSWKCDGDRDCPDGSDEAISVCKDRTNCPVNKLPCRVLEGAFICAPGSWRCDGELDCKDGTDEKNCTTRTSCTEDEFSCERNGTCISKTWLCDGDRDCPDGSDEDVSTCKENNRCLENQFLCNLIRSGVTCVPKHWRCDGEYDCKDGADEKLCSKSESCKETHFRCSDGSCIPKLWKCDGHGDCPGGSDEGLSICKDSKTCPDSMFLCSVVDYGGVCVPVTWRCDGHLDCENGHDEANCTGVVYDNTDVRR
ncbi:hypothetical protein HPB50_018327 [Hyalomma asiaticum]|uniref:Uncharacterized protein n=1 Tax=Hyalomma asiaticum TaxID=266040 RepID=A0ACB7RJD7_HYAAI|nr:hypothetical protein HPB50_018327 [Hyalomma asiaticum]